MHSFTSAVLSCLILLSCTPKKQGLTPFISAPFPELSNMEPAQQKNWLHLFFSTATPVEQQENWTILLDEQYRQIRIDPLVSLIERAPAPIILTGLLAHPKTTNIERCIIGFHAKLNNVKPKAPSE